jgi:DNA-binding NtrC family response regulator
MTPQETMGQDIRGAATRHLTLLGHGTPRVLIVDDEPSITRALAIACGRAGLEVLSTTSADEAHRIVQRQHVDVLLVDLRMPEMRGDVFYHLATSIQPHLRRQTLFITGDISPRAQELIGACGTPFLHKPFELSDVLEAVRALAPVALTA